VPAHNSACYIEQALSSVEQQTFADWDVVVADDASSDDTADIAARFAPRVACVRSDTNVGPAAARNLALAAATGELVAFLDADDYWMPEFLERHIAAFDTAQASGLRPGIVTGDVRVLGPDGFAATTYRSEHPLDGPPSLARLLERNPIFISSLAPRAAIDEVGPMDHEIWGAEDYDLWLRIVEAGYSVVVLPDVLAVYRRHDSALTSSQARAAGSQALAYARALERGRLGSGERRIARRQLRYSRAVEAVALAAEPGPHRGRARWRLVAKLPLVAFVAVTNPRLWPLWLHGIRSRITGR
jgi:glycosyltransferase involved in cell wall biosynthesis